MCRVIMQRFLQRARQPLTCSRRPDLTSVSLSPVRLSCSSDEGRVLVPPTRPVAAPLTFDLMELQSKSRTPKPEHAQTLNTTVMYAHDIRLTYRSHHLTRLFSLGTWALFFVLLRWRCFTVWTLLTFSSFFVSSCYVKPLEHSPINSGFLRSIPFIQDLVIDWLDDFFFFLTQKIF